MTFVFLSHASEDKQDRVKPVAEALLLQGVSLWLDRPGQGEGNFGFSEDFIDQHSISSLVAGRPWDDQIREALHQAGAVLICLSKALSKAREIWVHEFLIGAYQQKLVACIVDDLLHADIPQLGLVPSQIQAERIDPKLLRNAVDIVLQAGILEVGAVLPPLLLREWEITRKLVSDIHVILDRSGLRPASAVEMTNATRLLAEFPIGPAVRLSEIPPELVALFANRFRDPALATSFFERAMQLVRRCKNEGFTDRQMIVGPGELLNPKFVTSDEYWSAAFSRAGLKSRRTLAALLLAPGAPRVDRPELAEILPKFLAWLKTGWN
ncbi:toll/interleukin-1 receptor domain-containing protein [Methylocystis sp.]|uniref:toll/interleukin-1 receptor domain-containing protein n=1 Tax=Methylocystis sp. TaxID=1911079 RepID=UPI0025D6629D|nr:toll/interleukin-1 receptor domain-containing protein [Methylocystis sp.]